MQLATTTWGDRSSDRVAVLLHGITGHSASWWRIGPLLAEAGFRVLAPDLPGHGLSGPTTNTGLSDLVADVVDTVGGHMELLVGHSFGGTLALHALTTHALEVHALVLEDPVVSLSAAHATQVVDLETAWWPDTVDGARQRRPGWNDQEVVDTMLARVQLDVDTARDMWTGNAPWDLSGAFAATRQCAATAVLVPEHSPYLGPDDADMIETATSPGSVVRLAGMGHQVHRDDPARFMSELQAVLSAAGSPAGRG